MKKLSGFSYLLGIESLAFIIGNLSWRPFLSDLQLIRIGQTANWVFLISMAFFLIFGTVVSKNWLTDALGKWFSGLTVQLFTISGVLSGLIIISIAAIIFAYTLPVFNALGFLGIILRQTMWVWMYIGFTCLQMLFYLIYQVSRFRSDWNNGKWPFLSSFVITIAAALVAGFSAALILRVSFVRIIAAFHLSITLVILAMFWYWGYLGSKHRKTKKWDQVKSIERLFLVFGIAFLFYQVTAIIIGNVNTPSKSYFDELARAFLQGKLYLENPTSTHDLTYFEGKWYLPFPPLAALIMVPLVKIYGDVGFSTVTFTIFFAALNCALLFEILRLLSRKCWINLRENQVYWIVLCFALGTPFWYMTVVGKVWYIERILALTFMLLAVCLSLKKYSPLVIGIAFGLSLWSRPNGVFLWPLLVGIYLQQSKEGGNLTFRAVIKWIFINAIPIIIAVYVLLYYNWIRFGNWFDFGYQNQNVGQNAANVISDGFFNMKVIPRNFTRMLLDLPIVDQSCRWIFVPNHLGMSIFFTTPILFYIFKGFRKTLFVFSVWLALILEILLLLMQNGITWEFGYSYILDIITPLMVLLSIGLGQKISTLMKVLIFLGIGINLWGLLWYFGFYCPVF